MSRPLWRSASSPSAGSTAKISDCPMCKPRATGTAKGARGFFSVSGATTAAIEIPCSIHLAHQIRDRGGLRIGAALERGDNARPVARRTVLAQLELAFEPVDRDLDADNAFQHRLHIGLGQLFHPPRRRLARLVPIG